MRLIKTEVANYICQMAKFFLDRYLGGQRYKIYYYLFWDLVTTVMDSRFSHCQLMITSTH